MSVTYVTAIIDCTCRVTSTTYACHGREHKGDPAIARPGLARAGVGRTPDQARTLTA